MFVPYAEFQHLTEKWEFLFWPPLLEAEMGAFTYDTSLRAGLSRVSVFKSISI